MHIVSATSIFPIGHIYDQVVADDGRQRAFACLAALLTAFFLIRTSARMTRRFSWWPGGVKTEQGVHLHHFVWGIFLMLATGFVGVSLHLHEPWGEVVAILFGVGAGLTLDEFALWTRLEDVYWSEKGRSSIEAVAIVGTVGMLVVIGVRPFELDDPASDVTVSLVIALTLAISVVAFLKGRILLGTVGLFVFPVGVIGAVRIGHPESPWARRRYSPGSSKLACSRRRFEDPNSFSNRLKCRLMDAVGGRPSVPEQGPIAQTRGDVTKKT